MTNKDLTIIIVAFNSEGKIQKCLNSVDSNFKVIVVENSQNSTFKNQLENNFPNVECILTGENIGYGKANNIALKKVQTKYSLILNPDTQLEKNALNNFINTSKINSNFAIIGPTEGQFTKKLEVEKKEKLIEVDSIKGFAMFLNMEKFKEIGFFDENIFLYFEEIDLCKRVKKNNEIIFLDPSIKIFHDGGKSVNQDFSYKIELTRNWHWMWSTFYYHKKHYNFFNAFIKIGPKFFSALFKSLFYTLINNKKKKEIYFHRLSGIINSILGKSSWHRQTLD
jgi:N-acetylglucosaminyl-diphospho-decaprenol L-rhamnosyltransferase